MFGQVANGVFHEMATLGGPLRQLFSVGTFTRPDGGTCNVPVEIQPANATVPNVGRLTPALFGLGLVDALPDSVFGQAAAAEPTAQRGLPAIVTTVLPNPLDPSQTVGGPRVGRFGWKADGPNLVQVAAAALVDDMGITTQHCIGGQTVTAFATEPAPNGVDEAASGCDDLDAANDGSDPDVPAHTDEAAGSCAGGATRLAPSVQALATFLTFLAPPAPDNSDPAAAKGKPVFTQIGCAACHRTQGFTTPAAPANGVPGNMTFFPYSDFLVHGMGALGDGMAKEGDSATGTNPPTLRMRTAPLWGIRFRSALLHDGRTSDIATAIKAHAGQAAAAASAFIKLSTVDQHNLVAFVRSL
jgi:CxxC motif-containing protein (DUF1111 family)